MMVNPIKETKMTNNFRGNIIYPEDEKDGFDEVDPIEELENEESNLPEEKPLD